MRIYNLLEVICLLIKRQIFIFSFLRIKGQNNILVLECIGMVLKRTGEERTTLERK